MTAHGIFITFEGIDGSGKSTQMRLLAHHLVEHRRLPVVVTREPGGTPLGAGLRKLLLDGREAVDPLAELLLYAADRAQHVATILRPELAANNIVLSDRYSDATLAYQGAGRKLPSKIIAQLVQLATGGLKPNLTLVFDLPLDEAHARQAARAERGRDRLEREATEFQLRVQTAYHQLAHAEPRRVRLVDASGSIETTHKRVLEIVLPFLEAQQQQHDST